MLATEPGGQATVAALLQPHVQDSYVGGVLELLGTVLAGAQPRVVRAVANGPAMGPLCQMAKVENRSQRAMTAMNLVRACAEGECRAHACCPCPLVARLTLALRVAPRPCCAQCPLVLVPCLSLGCLSTCVSGLPPCTTPATPRRPRLAWGWYGRQRWLA